ncbi:SGF29 tudor-like domain-containing protein [Bombardia bombarda]|uniref:SGF29 tudor-like domain-containing protein n=1 Tax=Bombardia bombarda TaxID=252184 RepID=A0AA39X8T5_9PEZI|nr:SGF29 tudor-like domain-containing protein [Bombardia bombarda]
MGSHSRRLGGSAGGGSDRSGNRDSVPPRGGDRDTPGKGDSVPPESSVGAGSATAAQRAKVTFHKGQDVVFKPKPSATTESTEWMMGKVQQVLGEGKSRRYKVQDADPDLPPDQRVEYRTSASSMIPIPAADVVLPELDKGKTVLALYPDSTTFYKAEVMGADAATGRVSLRFEGEENSVTLQLVDRRYVVEYRN